METSELTMQSYRGEVISRFSFLLGKVATKKSLLAILSYAGVEPLAARAINYALASKFVVPLHPNITHVVRMCGCPQVPLLIVQAICISMVYFFGGKPVNAPMHGDGMGLPVNPDSALRIEGFPTRVSTPSELTEGGSMLGIYSCESSPCQFYVGDGGANGNNSGALADNLLRHGSLLMTFASWARERSLRRASILHLGGAQCL